MEDPGRIRFRHATARDAEHIARLHADSWQRHYRGAYSDTFLDGDVFHDRLSVWANRLGQARTAPNTIVAEAAERLLGFAHTILDEDPTWGALLDNLHVAQSRARRRIGTRLLGLTAGAVAERRPGSGLHLWVLEQNLPAQAFYRARGGQYVERRDVQPPGGDVSRLNGSPVKLRFAWPDPAAIAPATLRVG